MKSARAAGVNTCSNSGLGTGPFVWSRGGLTIEGQRRETGVGVEKSESAADADRQGSVLLPQPFEGAWQILYRDGVAEGWA